MKRKKFLQLLGAGFGISALGSASNQAGQLVPKNVEDESCLERWKRQPMIPLLDGETEAESEILAAIKSPGTLHFSYLGGSEPGRQRHVMPLQLFLRPSLDEIEAWMDQRETNSKQVELDLEDLGHLRKHLRKNCPVYLTAWCQLRGEQRCFRLDRMNSMEAGSRGGIIFYPGKYDAPDLSLS